MEQIDRILEKVKRIRRKVKEEQAIQAELEQGIADGHICIVGYKNGEAMYEFLHLIDSGEKEGWELVAVAPGQLAQEYVLFWKRVR